MFPQLEDDSEPDLLLGGAMFLLSLAPSEWIRRRVESVSFLDAWSMRRKVSVDFETPADELIGYEPLEVIPLALIEKGVLVSFDLRDEQGASLPVLTRSENSFVAWSTLVRAAQWEVVEQLGADISLSNRIVDQLRPVAAADPDEALKALEDLLHEEGNDIQQRSILKDSSYFINLAYDLATRFLLLTPLEPHATSRRIVKFSYAQELEPRPGKRWLRFVGKMGWRPTQFDFSVPAIGEAASYHFEFAAPPGLSIAEAELLVLDPEEGESKQPAVIAGTRAHAYISGELPQTDGVVSLWLWPTRAGMLRVSALTSLLITGVLVFFLLGERLEKVTGDAIAALLLAIPGLIAAYVVRPGEHGMVTDLLVGVRGQIALAGATAYGAAVIVIGEVSGSVLTPLWWILTIIAGVCSLSLGVAYLGFQPKRVNMEQAEPLDLEVDDG